MDVEPKLELNFNAISVLRVIKRAKECKCKRAWNPQNRLLGYADDVAALNATRDVGTARLG